MQPTTTEGATVNETLIERYEREEREALATIKLCQERKATCQPRSRFAYAAQITKAEGKLNRAGYELARLRRMF